MRSAFAQTGVDPAAIELVVADNDVTPSAKSLVSRLAKDAPFPVRYVHEPEPGVANVRNAALSIAKGQFIASLDDDEEAAPGWLSALLGAQARFDADAVFGPVIARVPDSVTDHRDYLQRFYSRTGPARPCVVEEAFGCGNSLMRRAAMGGDAKGPFKPRSNFIGGEDDVLFTAMRAAGKRFAWAADAVVYEHPAPERLTLAYAIPRAFAYGQGAPSRCASATPANPAGVVGWMAVGLAQGVLHAPVAGLKWLARSPDRAAALDRLVRGLGKTFWWKPFKIRFYGLAEGQSASRL